MEKECFTCKSPGSNNYTVVLERGKILEDNPMCEVCVSEFREVEWIEVHEEPVLMRGGDRTQEDEELE